MPVLLLSRGDKEARDLLRKALEARYGVSVPAIETLKIEFRGRARTKLGPITTWLPFETTIYFRFPTQGRWDFNVRATGVNFRLGSITYDGGLYHSRWRDGEVKTKSDPTIVRSTRLRIFTAAGMLLTPLAEEFIEVKTVGERSFEATNLDTRDKITLTLRDDYTVDTVSAMCPNPDEDFEEQLFSYQALDGHCVVNDLMIPCKFIRAWNNVAAHEIVPRAVETNLPFSPKVFTLENGV